MSASPGAGSPEAGPTGAGPTGAGPTEAGPTDAGAAGDAPAEQRTPRAWLAARRRRLRRPHLIAIAVGLVLFVAISVVLARFLSTENVERDAVLAVLQAQAEGRPERMLERLDGCRSRPACLATVKVDATRLRRKGSVKILLLKSKTAYALTGGTGMTRVAWTIIGELPVVQCLKVRRTGDFLTGMSVTLLSIGPRISGEGEC